MGWECEARRGCFADAVGVGETGVRSYNELVARLYASPLQGVGVPGREARWVAVPVVVGLRGVTDY